MNGAMAVELGLEVGSVERGQSLSCRPCCVTNWRTIW